MDHLDFANFLNERLRERGFNIKRLSELTGVSVKHLEAIFSGNPERLPSAPYLKGYLSKLGQVLDFNAAEVWEQMRKFTPVKSSGKSDELPKNRFSKRPLAKYITIGTILFILLFYAGFRFYKISGTPVITVSYPAENMAVVKENYVSLAGRVSNSDDFRINNEQVEVRTNGEWQKNVSLQPGINTVEITAKKFLGRETKIVRQIVYEQGTSTVQEGVFQNQGF